MGAVEGNTKPERIRRSRVKGWRKPENTVIVTRPGKWGNPFAAKGNGRGGEEGAATMTRQYLVDDFREWLLTPVTEWPDRAAFARGDTGRTHLMGVPYQGRPTLEQIRAELGGKNLACYCHLDQPCHANVLLELANGAVSL